MVATSDRLLGIGLYTPAEAALYARVASQKLIRWAFGNNNGESVFIAQRARGEDRNVSFLDFIQILSVRSVRTQFPEVPLAEIRDAIINAKRDFDLAFPLAVQNKKISVFGKRLIIEIGNNKNAELIELGRKHRGQRAFHEVVELFVRHVEFDADGLAVKFTAHASESGKIVMDPKVRMGEPLVLNCGYTAQSLAEAVKNEGSIKNAAHAYGVTVQDITVACEYMDLLVAA